MTSATPMLYPHTPLRLVQDQERAGLHLLGFPFQGFILGQGGVGPADLKHGLAEVENDAGISLDD